MGYRRPRDGAAWSTWEIDSKKAKFAHLNWPLEAIRAPSAWGCETGSTATNVAVLDYYFHSGSELGGNRLSTDYRDLLPPVLASPITWHGDAVSEIMAARGNDSAGMTGVMWRAGLRQYELTSITTVNGATTYLFKNGAPVVRTSSLRKQLIAAVRNGARVINLSSFVRNLSAPITAADSAPLLAAASQIASGMRYVEKTLNRPLPLLVIIAGNNGGLDAGASGLPLLVKSYPRYASSVLIVAATQFGVSNTVNVWSRSSTGPLVDIAAPGMDINLKDPSGGNQTAEGTSVAAPYVAGVAGLLFSFDSSLTAPLVKQLILDGARNGGRTALYPGGSYPFLDAYEALKAAAARPGAPLCGNRVHSIANGDVVAERPGHADEMLFTSLDGAPYTELLNVMHGGKRIQIGDYLQFSWNHANPSSSHWAQVPYSGAYHQDAGGAFLSWYDGSDHDATAHVVSNSTMVSGSVYTTPQLISTNYVLIKNLPPVVRPMLDVNGGFVCANGPADSALKSCSDPNSYRVFAGSWVLPAGFLPWAYAPQGDFVLQGINYHYLSQHYAGAYSSSGQLVPTDAPRDTSVSLELWKVDTASGAIPQQLPISDGGALSRPGLLVEWVAIDETGTEFVWQIGKSIKDVNTGTFSCTERVIEYRALPGHPNVVAGKLVRPVIPQPDSDQCQSFGAASFSPTRIGAAAMPDTGQSNRRPIPGGTKSRQATSP